MMLGEQVAVLVLEDQVAVLMLGEQVAVLMLGDQVAVLMLGDQVAVLMLEDQRPRTQCSRSRGAVQSSISVDGRIPSLLRGSVENMVASECILTPGRPQSNIIYYN